MQVAQRKLIYFTEEMSYDESDGKCVNSATFVCQYARKGLRFALSVGFFAVCAQSSLLCTVELCVS